ncbi:MAG: hypothetical protein KC503_40265 [Myxococcales bacterium]|nr:hypothetical protein [Myxococcales bacterium]
MRALALTAVLLVLAPQAFARAKEVALAPLPGAAKRTLFATPEDTLDKKPCVGLRVAASVDCRDRKTHFKSNEWDHHVWVPYIRDVGGAYVGIGSDQGLTLIAAARSTFAWLLDYDPAVVLINRVHRALILSSPTREAFIAQFLPKNKAAAIATLERAYKGSPERALVVAAFTRYRAGLRWYFNRVQRERRELASSHWLHTDDAYSYVRRLFQLDRIRILKGDLLRDRALVGIGKASHALRMPVRVLYLSNAEEYWRYTDQFRKNIRGLRFDSRTIVLRTRTNRRANAKLLGRYQYTVQAGLDFQQRLADPRVVAVWSILKHRARAFPDGLFTVGLRPLSRRAMRSALPGWRPRRAKSAALK